MEIKSHGAVTIVFLDGNIHRESEDEIKEIAEMVLNDPQCKTVIISFKDVIALLSDGIRQIVVFSDLAARAKKEFHITELPKEVHYALQITNLLDMLGYKHSLKDVLGEKGTSLDKFTLRDETRSMKTVQSQDNTTSIRPPAEEKTEEKSEDITKLKDIGNVKRSSERIKRRKTGISTKRLLSLSDADLRKLISEYVPGRLELLVLECMIRHHRDVYSVEDIVLGVHEDKKKVKGALKRLLARGTIDSMGGGLFNYSPTDELKAKISSLLRLYNSTESHTRVLRVFLDREARNR